MQPNNRINIFNPIHKALRALLYQTALHIQQTDFTNDDEALETIGEVEAVVSMFEAHAQHEDNFILPVINPHDKSIGKQFEAEHEEDERLSKVLLAAISAWQEAEDNSVQIQAGQILFYHFNAFVAFNLYHMNKEESVLNNVLWKHYSDEQISSVQQAIVASVSPQAKAVQSRWMFRGLSNPEITNWLQKIKAEAPSQVFHMHVDLAEEELDTIRWNAIHTSLADAVMVG